MPSADTPQGGLATPRALNASRFRATPKQFAYVLERSLQVQQGQWLSQADTAKRVQCTPTTISMWNRSVLFLEWYAEQVRQAQAPLVEHAKTAILLKTIQGNVRFAELFLQMHGYLDGPPELERQGNGGHAVANVTFIGLPVPPTPAEVAARNPPIGSNIIIPAPVLR